MRIAILTDKPRFQLFPNEETFREDEQKRKTVQDLQQIISKIYECYIFEAEENIITKLKKNNINFVFNMANGIMGCSKLSQIPAILEFAGIPYTGSSVIGHALALNKIYTCQILENLGIATPDFIYVYDEKELDHYEISFPVLVKPCDEGSSRGIYQDSLVYDISTLKQKVAHDLDMYNPPIMVTEFIEGREFHVGLLGNYDDILVLPIEEICFDNLPQALKHFYSFEVKAYHKDKTVYRCPASIDENLDTLIKDLCIKAFNALSLRDYARFDVRVKDNTPYILEVNSLPGLLRSFSALPRMADACGLEYEGLIFKILESAFKRYDLSIYKAS